MVKKNAKEKWNTNRIKRLDFIDKRLLEKKEARAYINNVGKAMLNCYQIFAKRIKPLPPEPQLSNFQNPSEEQQNSKLLFVAVGTDLATYAIYNTLNKWQTKTKGGLLSVWSPLGKVINRLKSCIKLRPYQQKMLAYG